MKTALLAPTNTSLYSRLLAESILRQDELTLEAIIVRRMFSWKRLRGELRRDGPRLIHKVAQKLVLGEERSTLPGEISLAALAQERKLSAPNLRILAERYRVPFCVAPDHNHPRVESVLRTVAPDVLVFSGGGLIRENILSIPERGVLNCHAGVLPLYRGMDVVEWAVLESDGEPPPVGLTTHFMEKGVDTGPILEVRNLSIRQGDTFAAMRTRLEPMMVELMMETLLRLASEDITARPQGLDEGKQYFVMHPRVKELAAARLGAITKV